MATVGSALAGKINKTSRKTASKSRIHKELISIGGTHYIRSFNLALLGIKYTEIITFDQEKFIKEYSAMENPQVTAARLKSTHADELIIAAFAEKYGNSLMLYEELLNADRISITIHKGNNPALWELCSQLFGEDKELQQLLRQKIIHLTLMGLSENAIPCTQETIKEKLNATLNLVPSYEHKIFLQYRIELDLAIQEGQKSKRLPIKTTMAFSLDNLIAITNLLAKYGAKQLEVNDNKFSSLKKRDHYLRSYIISLPSTVTKLDLVIASDWANNEIIDPFLQIPADILQKINLVIVSNPKNNLSEKASLMGEVQRIFQNYLKTSDFVGAKSIIKVMKVLDEEIAQSLQQRLNDISKGNWSDKATHPIVTPEPEPSSVTRMIFREWH